MQIHRDEGSYLSFFPDTLKNLLFNITPVFIATKMISTYKHKYVLNTLLLQQKWLVPNVLPYSVLLF